MRAVGGEDVLLFLSVERVETPAKGRSSGGDGAPGRIRVGEGPDLPGKGEVRIPAGELLVFETPGGGGFGDVSERDAELGAADRAAGLVE